MENTTTTNQYVKIPEAAKHIGMPARALRHAVHLGLLPYYKIGTAKLFKLSELEEALKGYRVASKAEVLS